MQEILNSSKFNALVSQKNLIAFLLTCIQLVVYYGFIYLLAFKKKEVLSIKITEGIPLGIPLGIGVIVMSWVLTGIYTYWANNFYDKMVEEVKKEIRGNL